MFFPPGPFKKARIDGKKSSKTTDDWNQEEAIAEKTANDSKWGNLCLRKGNKGTPHTLTLNIIQQI